MKTSTQRKRARSATWRKGHTENGVVFYYAPRPVLKSKDVRSPSPEKVKRAPKKVKAG